jgi:hypothetical protein
MIDAQVPEKEMRNNKNEEEWRGYVHNVVCV